MNTFEAPRALVVDDVPLNRRILRNLLAFEGVRADEVEHADAAIAALEKQRYDLVLLDVDLGVRGRTGWDVLEAIAREKDGPSVIMVTGAACDARDVARGLRRGARDYLTRPVPPEVFRARVAAALRGRPHAERAHDHHESVCESQATLARTAGRLRTTGAIVSLGSSGGDACDVVTDRAGRTSIVLVDAAGHGPSATPFAWSALAVASILLRNGAPLDQVCHAVETTLARVEGARSTVAMAIARFSEEEVEILNAGLPPVAIVDGLSVELVSPHAPPVGLFDWRRVETSTMPFRRPMLLAMLTDGVLGGALDGASVEQTLERMGANRYGALLATATPPQVTAMVRESLARFPSGQRDDASLVFAAQRTFRSGEYRP